MISRLKRGRYRILLYIGIERPPVCTDYAESLVSSLLRSGHDIAGAVVRSTDRLLPFLRKGNIPVITLPEELALKAPEIKKVLAEDGAFRKYFRIWIGHLNELGPGLGITCWGTWIPSEIFNIPPYGFLNYHPAPLPDLRGMEPDTFAILEGRECVHGTIHELSHGFDTGRIVAVTKKIKIRKYDTPVSLLDRLNHEGIRSLCKVIPLYAEKKLTPVEQGSSPSEPATLKRAREASTIDWQRDGSEMIFRKLRAFCGQDIGIRLKAIIAGQVYNVTDLELWKGDFPGSSGDLIGRYCGSGIYHNMPVVRISDGVAVFRTTGIIEPLSFSSIYYPEAPMFEQIPACRRPLATSLKEVKKSIRAFSSLSL